MTKTGSYCRLVDNSGCSADAEMMVVLSQPLNISSIKEKQRTYLLLPKMELSLVLSLTLLSDFTFFLFFALLNIFLVSQNLYRVF